MQLKRLRSAHALRSIALASCLAIGLLGALLTPPDSSATSITVFLLGGQSNATGLGDNADLSGVLAEPQLDVSLYHGDWRPIIPSDVWLPLQPGAGNGAGFGPELSFGRAMSDATGSMSNSVAIIKYARFGSNLISDWRASGDATTAGDGPLYQQFQSTVSGGLSTLSAMNPSTDIILGGMLWMQGESDTAGFTTASEYALNLEAFIDDVRLTYAADLAFSIGRLSINQTALNAAHLETVRDAQTAVAAADPLTGLVDTDSFGLLPDNLHFDSGGQIALGQGFAVSLLAIPEPSPNLLLLLGLVLMSSRRRWHNEDGRSGACRMRWS